MSAKADEFNQFEHSLVCAASSLNMHRVLDYPSDSVAMLHCFTVYLDAANLEWILCASCSSRLSHTLSYCLAVHENTPLEFLRSGFLNECFDIGRK